MFLFFYRLLKGYLYLRLQTPMPEKLLNLCAANGILLWGTALRGELLYVKIGIEDFKILRKTARTVPCKFHITKKMGFPFWVADHKTRYGAAVGFLLFCFLIWFLSGGIWNICIEGNSRVSSQQLTASLKQIGITEGTRLKKFLAKEKRNELLQLEPELAWASLNTEGCLLTLLVQEAEPAPQLQEEQPSNLKAAVDGVITKIKLLSGTAQVAVGDTVRQGDLLAAGLVEYSDQSTRFVRARGEIWANTVREYRLEQPLNITEVARTSRRQKRTVLQFFGLNIPLFCGSVPFAYEKVGQPFQFGAESSYVPIRKIEAVFYEVENKNLELSEEEAKRRLNIKLEEKLKQEVLQGEILEKNLRFYVENGTLKLQAVVKCDENIAIEEKIIKDTGN